MLAPVIEYYALHYNKPKLYFFDANQCINLNIFSSEENDNDIEGLSLIGTPSILVIENGKFSLSLVVIKNIRAEL